MNKIAFAATLLGLTVMAGCAAQHDDDTATTPGVETDTAEGQQIVYSTNADGTWSANAQTPYGNGQSGITGGATFTGPANKTRKMGVCLLRQFGNTTGTNCNTVSDCGAAPANLPSDGYRYCMAPNGVGQKKCYYRPGPASTYCAGSPANGFVPIAPGSYSKSVTIGGILSKWMSVACFEGCAASDPSSSSQAEIFNEGNCGAYFC